MADFEAAERRKQGLSVETRSISVTNSAPEDVERDVMAALLAEVEAIRLDTAALFRPPSPILPLSAAVAKAGTNLGTRTPDQVQPSVAFPTVTTIMTPSLSPSWSVSVTSTGEMATIGIRAVGSLVAFMVGRRRAVPVAQQDRATVS